MPARSFARLALSLSLALAVPALGCAGASARAPIVVAGGTRAPVAQGAHGPVKLMGEALGDVPLTPAQRAEIEQLAADAEGRHAAARAAGRELVLTIATQVEAGALDRAALQPKIDAVTAAMRASQPADRAALERLHAILVPDQRVAFVDAVEARAHEGMGRARGEHPLRKWATDLKLSDEQRSRIRALLEQGRESGPEHGERPGWQEGKRRGAKVFEAFKQDRFVMDEVAPAGDEAGTRAARMGDHFLGVAGQVLPVLTPEQRVIAARKLRERADDPNGGALPLPSLGGRD